MKKRYKIKLVWWWYVLHITAILTLYYFNSLGLIQIFLLAAIDYTAKNYGWFKFLHKKNKETGEVCLSHKESNLLP